MERLHETMTTPDPDPIAILAASITRQRKLASQAHAVLAAETPRLVDAIRHGSGQSAKIEAILWSIWNGELCDALAGLDTTIAEAVVAMIAARAHMGGDADDLIRTIINATGSQPSEILLSPFSMFLSILILII